MKTVLLSSVMDLVNLKAMVDGRFINVKKHPREDLYILDYSPQAQFKEEWNNETVNARGLIVRAPNGIYAEDATVHARPFAKFFNVSQHVLPEDARVKFDGTKAFSMAPLPVGEDFDVFVKADGSLGVLSTIEGQPTITTRGSFFSEQAMWATQHLRETYPGFTAPEGVTLLFEIIYPENRIVVDYKGFKGLVLLAAVDIATGKDVPLPKEWTGPVIEQYDAEDFDQLKALVDSNPEEYGNSEGFVVRFTSGVRAKMKFAEYVRLHRVVTGISNKTIYQHLGVKALRDHYTNKEIAGALAMSDTDVETLRRVPDPVQSLIDEVPDEMYQWLKDTISGFETDFERRKKAAQDVASTLPSDPKAAAAIAMQYKKHPEVDFSLVFDMYRGFRVDRKLFKLIRPVYSSPFRTDDGS